MIKQPLSLFLFALVGACARQEVEPARDVAFYRGHAEERHEMMARCSNDPGGIGQTANCINARQAARIEDRTRLRDVPSMGLSDPPKEAGDAEHPDRP